MTIDTGGQAFPCDSREAQQFAGMTLRDFYAGLAMQGLMRVMGASEVSCAEQTGIQPWYTEGDPTTACQSIAVTAYVQADAMIAEKRRTEATP